MDPGSGLAGMLDVGIRGGVIAAVERNLDAQEAAETLDAAGLVVTPGLFDLHTHAYWGATYWGIEPDPLAARTGVTTWADAGTAGGYGFPGFRRHAVEGSDARVLAFLNVSCIGLVAPTYELSNPDYGDLKLARETVEANRDVIVGIKARIDPSSTRGTGLEAMRWARSLADEVRLPLMVHIGKAPPLLEEILVLMRPGDILTHCCTGHENRLLGPDGRVRDTVRRMWKDGLVLDVGHGTGSFRFESAERMMADGVIPDVISTDAHQLSIQGPMFDLPTTVSKFLALGMSLPDAVERVTARPARAVRRPELACLKPGAVADVAVFQVESGDFIFRDVDMKARSGRLRLVNRATIRAGKRMALRPLPPLAPWAELPEEQREVKS